MKEDDKGIVNDILSAFEGAKAFFASAVLLVFGINLISSYLSNMIIGSEKNSIILIVLGLCCCIPSVIYLISRLLSECKKNRTYQAFIVHDIKKNEIILVPRYVFSEQMYLYINSSFEENPELKAIWDRKPLHFIADLESDRENDQKNTANQLLSEYVECFLLNKLSFCLIDYYDNNRFDKEKIKLYSRENMSDIVLTNRVLDLISMPMEERPFRKERMYINYFLYLPIGSSISRSKNNKIEIKSKDMNLFLSVLFRGFNANLPRGFAENYLGLDYKMSDIDVYELKINIELAMKLRLLFSRKDWKIYHNWVDLYINQLEKDVSQNAFFDFINWETAHTIIQCLENNEETQNKNGLTSLLHDIASTNVLSEKSK